MQSATTGVDALVVLFNALGPEEQEDSYERIGEARLRRLAGDESSMARFIRSMGRVAEYVGHVPSVDEYKQASEELRAAGEDIETFSRLYKHFQSWPRAKEALALSDTTTARRIDARFRSRKVGKVWRFTEESLRTALRRCAEHYSRPPTVAEYEWWRDRELELARAQGDESLMLPSSGPYRRRYKTWERALLQFGFTLEEVELRHDHRAEFTNGDADRYLPQGLPIAKLAQSLGGLPLSDEQVERVRDAYERLPLRSRYVLTARLGLAVAPQTLKSVAKPLALHLSRIRTLQVLSLDALCDAAAGEGRARPEPVSLREDVENTLRALAVADESTWRGL